MSDPPPSPHLRSCTQVEGVARVEKVGDAAVADLTAHTTTTKTMQRKLESNLRKKTRYANSTRNQVIFDCLPSLK